MKKILIYAGCHGKIISDFLSLDKNINISFIQNWEYIRDGIPFPLSELKKCDVFIYSPIYNKDNYNTDKILNEISDFHIKSISFPWLQWNGYFPFYKQHGGLISNNSYQWWYCSFLKELALKTSSFQDFCYKSLSDDLIDHETIKNLANDSLNRLSTEGESDSLCCFNLSNLIRSSYTEEQLFLIPDHPSNLIYQKIFYILAHILNIKLSEDHYKFINQSNLFHSDSRVPILPCVSKALNLKFENNLNDFVFYNKFLFKKPMLMNDFLLLHYDTEHFLKSNLINAD